MAGEPDLQESLNERFHRVDEKLDKVIDVLAKIRAAMLQILASHNNRMLRLEMRPGDIDADERLARQNREEAARAANARHMGYEDVRCWECRNFTLVRNGTCLRCDTCSAASGCG